ncbi:MAG TPA: hypothetical protein VGL19_24190, partial [Polyangiaceae bacterium]
DFEAEQVVPGFDRVYVLGRRPDRFAALDGETGAALGLGSLPASPGFGKMAFVDAWFGAVQVPLRGTLVSFDAGGSWRPLGSAGNNVSVDGGELRLSGADGTQNLDRNGTFSRREEPSAALGTHENEVARALRAASSGHEDYLVNRELSGQRALKLAVLRGFRDADGSLVVANSGTLSRVRASDGKLLESDEHAYAGGGECNALAYGKGFAFACDDSARQTTLFAFVPPFRLRALRTFGGPRFVASSGNGALVIRGGCGETTVGKSGAYCIAGTAGGFREMLVRGDAGVERVVALGDGRVAVVVPPRLSAPGFLSLVDATGKEQRVPLKLPKASPSTALLEKGLWLDGFVERSAGGLAGWVVGAEPFVGVRVALDGTVTASPPESGIDRALLSGTRALLVGRTGRAVESTDGGFEWSDVDLPYEFDATRELRDDARLQGCSELGCAFGGFVRVGWKAGSAAPPLRVATLPTFTSLLQPGGSRWLLRCEATGEASEPALALAAHARAPGRSDDNVTAAWAPFLETTAPALLSGEIGFDVGPNDSESPALRAYVWGERGADWARAGHAQLRAVDRFDVARGVFESATSRSPWSDATAAAEAFGYDGTGNPTSWRAVLETGQRSAAVLASSRGLLDLLLFEEGKTVTRIPNAGRLGFGMLSSVTKLSDAWYAASFNENHAFTLSRIAGSRVERLAEYSDTAREQGSISLVRGARRDELGIWVIGRGWYLFPIDPKTFAVLSPLYESPADLAQMPPACAPGSDGFLLSGSPTLEPNLRFAKPDDISARRVEAQFIWSAGGVCTRALAADTDSIVKRSLTVAPAPTREPSRAAGVPLTVSERRPQGRRWGYTCAP